VAIGCGQRTAEKPATPQKEGEEARGGVLRIGTGTDVLTFDLPNYRSTMDLLVGDLVLDTLVTMDVEMKQLLPRLAVSWQQVNDTTYVFDLRKGVTFTDGTPFNAEAVKVNFERTAKALKGSRFYGAISSVKVLDEYKVEFALSKPFAPFLTNLAQPIGVVYSPEALKKYGEDIYKNPVGTGMFKLEEWVPNDHVTLVRNDKYWGTPPKLEKVIFRPIPSETTRLLAFKSGELDVIENVPPHEVAGLKNDPNYLVIMSPQMRTFWVGFNCGDPVLKDKNVRKAIAHAIDRKQICAHTLEGLAREASFGLIPPEVMPTDPPLENKFDQELAKQLLAQAGYPNGLELAMWTTEGRYLKDRQIAEVVQGQLSKVGVKLKIQVMEYGSYVDALARHEQQMWLIGWAFSKHPDSYFTGCFHSASKANWSNYKNPALDSLIDEAVKVTDPEASKKLYWEIQKVLIDDAVAIPIYYMQGIYATTSKVHDFVAHPMEVFDLSKTWVAK
jgi:peptide/nickel transport system substrate-binding protein